MALKLVWLALVVCVMLPSPCLHTQILGGDLAGVVESADANSKVAYATHLKQALTQHKHHAAVYQWGQGVCSFSRLELHIKMGYGAEIVDFKYICVAQTAH